MCFRPVRKWWAVSVLPLRWGQKAGEFLSPARAAVPGGSPCPTAKHKYERTSQNFGVMYLLKMLYVMDSLQYPR